MKYFIVTIDTEGDNLWNWQIGKPITTNNVHFLNRFQLLCDRFYFKPVWLSNYEMLMNDDFDKFISRVVGEGKGECGMHLHAWNTPPEYRLPADNNSGAPYLIEYPKEIIEKKIVTMTALIKDRIGINPISHRAGRWAMNQNYFELLGKYGYKVDCSFTPGVNWKKSVGQTPGFLGPDYSRVNSTPHMVTDTILEVPVTIQRSHFLPVSELTFSAKTIKKIIRSISGYNNWIRPNGHNLEQMKKAVHYFINSERDYLMFMIHSSELMPGGSPTFQTENSIEKLYSDLEALFELVSKFYIGVTLEEYYNANKNKNKNGTLEYGI